MRQYLLHEKFTNEGIAIYENALATAFGLLNNVGRAFWLKPKKILENILSFSAKIAEIILSTKLIAN
jgi:hypothetical protein